MNDSVPTFSQCTVFLIELKTKVMIFDSTIVKIINFKIIVSIF